MKATYLRRSGKRMILLEAKNHEENAIVELFGRDGDTFTGKIEHTQGEFSSLLVLEKEM